MIPPIHGERKLSIPWGAGTGASYGASGMAEKRSQAPAKDVIASASVGAEPCPQAGIPSDELMAQSQPASCPWPSVFLRIRPIEWPSWKTQKSLTAWWWSMSVTRRVSFGPNGSPTSLQDTGSGARWAGMCDIACAMPANVATAMPSLSKVSQPGVRFASSRPAATALAEPSSKDRDDPSGVPVTTCNSSLLDKLARYALELSAL